MANILIVEDNMDLRELFSLALREKGFQVLLAANGQQALNVMGKNSVDLIVTDLMMPLMDGIHRMMVKEQTTLQIQHSLLQQTQHSMQSGQQRLVQTLQPKAHQIKPLIAQVRASIRQV